MPEISEDDLALILEALEDATFYRDVRSRVLDSAVRRQARRTGAPSPERSGDEVNREKGRAYSELAVRLKAARPRRR